MYFRDVNHLIDLIYNKKTSLYLIGIEFKGQQTKDKYNITKKILPETVNTMKRFSYVDRFNYNGGIISDTNWGCTIRSGQMVLYNAILFKLFKGNSTNCKSLITYFQNLDIFGINNILEIGEKSFGKKIGEMWQPKTFFLVIQHILAKNNDRFPSVVQGKEKGLTVLIMDSNFIATQIESRLQPDVNILLVINLSIGMNAPETKYRQFLFDVCRIPQFCGIVGGQNNMSYFIVGHNGTFFLYLDPHQIKSQKGQEDMNSYTVTGFYEIPYSSLLPYITLTFMINSDNFASFRQMLEKANEEGQPLGMFDTSELFKSTDSFTETNEMINFHLLKNDRDQSPSDFPLNMVKPLQPSNASEPRDRLPSFEEIDNNPFEHIDNFTSFKKVSFRDFNKPKEIKNIRLSNEIEGFQEVTMREESPRIRSNFNTKTDSNLPSTNIKQALTVLKPSKKIEHVRSSGDAFNKHNFKKR